MPTARGTGNTWKGFVVVRMDYENYLQEQNGWAKKLAAKADLDNGATDCDYVLLTIMAIYRLLVLSLQAQFEVDEGYRQNLPKLAFNSKSQAA